MPAPIQRFSLPSRLVAMAVLCVGVGATTIQPLWAAAPVASAPDPLAFSTTQPDNLPPLAPTRGAHGMAVSAQRLASEAGAHILAQGGNAADAAVAMGYALAVVYPAAGNLGGGGFMLLRPPGKQQSVFWIFGKSPRSSHPHHVFG